MIVEFILLLFVASPVLCSNTYYVTPNHDTHCLGQPCLTLSQYVQQSNHYFTSNTTFVFLAGDHSLHNNLALEGVTNVTLIGDSSLLPKITSKIKCTRSVNVEFDTVSKIAVTALAFASCGKETSNNGAIHLTGARDFLLSDCIFHDNAFTALSANHSSLTLKKIVFTNNSESALKIRSSTVTSIHNCTFSNNSGDRGGAAFIISSFVNLTGTTIFENNSGNYGGGLYLEYTTVRFTGVNLFRSVLYVGSASVVSFHGNSSFINNSADYGGGILAYNSTMNFEGNSSFINNSADYGGGIRAYNSTMIFEGDSSFINNLADYGGVIRADYSTMNFEGDSSFINNSADYGGGIRAYNSTMNFEGDSSFINNSADYGGGILSEYSTMIFEGDSSFINNLADYGGGIRAYNSTMNFEGDSSFINNSADYGGGILSEYSTMIFEGDSSFINNLADYGGGIRADYSTMNFEGDSSFINNSADYGGGILAYNGTMNFEGDSSFSNNSANRGGGISAYNSTTNFEKDSSFINNLAGYGGGIHVHYSTMNFEGESSFINNSADYGGGIRADYSIMNFEGESSLINNSADYGGGITADNSAMNFEGNSSFINNPADYGGGILAYNSIMNFEGDSSFINNSADYGGGIGAYISTMNFEGVSSFITNSAFNGGGIYANKSTMNFEGDSSFINNSADYGGGICADYSTVNFEGDSSFINNPADYGGGIFAYNSIVNFEGDSSFINNSAEYEGGGIGAYISTMNFEGVSSFITNSAFNGGGIYANKSTMNFEGDSSFINNPADYGGGITADNSTMNFEGNSSFINNSADYGGGICAYNGTVTRNFEGDCSFINNSADYGGGILTHNSITVFKGNSSFINNSADFGGGMFAYDSTINFEGNSSFINNSAYTSGGVLTHNSITVFKGDSSFINNSAENEGGGIGAYISTMNFEGVSSFITNSAFIGGGIYANKSTMNFEGDSSFINNPAGSGGGIIADNSTMNFEGNSSFINNPADYGGGGIRAYNYSTINFKGDSSFINNSADYGGGIRVYNSTINFERVCSFEFIYNAAIFGGGISAGSSTMNFDGNTSFINNFAIIEGGGINTDINTIIKLNGNCRFDNNSASSGGGIMVIASTMNIYGTCSFNNNSATYGGGIALDASTYSLFIQQGPRVYFTGNHAKRGGAINVFDSLNVLSQYCHQSEFSRTRRCFLQINPFEPSSNAAINASLIFENNSALEGGDHLYGGAIDYCENVAQFYANHGIDLIETLASGLSEDKLSDISSYPIKVCICDITDHPDCDRNINFTTYPGESFNITIVAVGQRDGTVAAVIQSIFNRESTANLKAEENFQSSNKTCTPLIYTVFSNTSSERIDLYAEGPCGPGLGQPLSLIVKLPLCPPGFELSPTIKSCICEKRLQTHTNSCDINSQTIFRADHSDFWVGYDNETGGLILHPHCPFDYCTSVHVSFTLNDSDTQCNYNRSGLLCGKCLSYFSLVLGTSRCLECSNNFLALITAFALAGLLLVFFLLICRLTVTVGTISGLIFYANIVSVNQTIFFPQDPNFSIRILKVFIAWLNLDLGIETCFYNGMDAYAKTWLQFVFPIYIWVLVGIVIISSRYLPIVARTLGTNPVAVLATLFLLSYTKILRTILAILSFTNLQYPNDITRTVWLYDGNITYFGGRHIPLFIIAITVFFALFLPYTLLLLLGQCLQARSNWRILAWVNSPRLKTIIDAYHGPYKVQRRYWPGLLLVIRIILLLVFSSNALHDPSVNLLAINTCTIALLALIWLVPGVHRKWYLEALEAFFILNLGILAAATLYVRATGGRQAVVVYILVGAAFVVFIGIIVYHMYLQISDIRKERKIRNYRRLRALQADEEIEAARTAAENQVPSQLDLERVITDETRALVPTTEVVVCKRETLLAMEADQTDTA